MNNGKDSSISFILYVKDQQKFKEFYHNLLGRKPVLDVSGMTEFELATNCVLGSMPEEEIVRVLEGKLQHPKEANGIPRCEVYM